MDRHDLIWNPWHGCHKHSEGCQNCYAFFLDKRYGRDTNEVARNKSGFDAPVKKDKNGNYKMPAGANIRVCMSSDFFIEEADDLVERKVYPEIPPRVEYSLSPIGKELVPIVQELTAWAAKNLPIIIKHRKNYEEK